MFALHTISDQASHPVLVREQFTMAKECGKGIDGLILALGVGYIEGLILSQEFNTNGYIFLENHLQSLENDLNFSELLNYFKLISEGKALYKDFVLDIENNEFLVSSILEFTQRVFSISANAEDASFVFEQLKNASADLNIQIFLYSEHMITKEVKFNKYIFPLVINVFHSYYPQLDDYYLLYHKDYTVICPENLNTSTLFTPSNYSLEFEGQEKVTELLIEAVKNLPSVSQEELNSIQDAISELKSISILGYQAVLPLNK